MERHQTRTDPIGATENFQYDGVGNLTRHTDRKGQVATFTYDALNHRTGSTYVDSSVSLTFDAVGRLTQATDTLGGTIANTYDVLDRLTAQTGALGTLSYQYDTLGRRTTMTAPGQTPVTYSYDAGSRLAQLLQGSQVVALQYDAAGRRTRLTLPNQVSTEHQHDTASRLTALIYRNAGALLGDLTYRYDAAGNRTKAGGSFARTLVPDPVASASYDAANRQLSFGEQTLSYDENGSRVSDGTTLYTWDARNRLATLSGPTPASFQYDPLGRRARKVITGSMTDFAYDGLVPVQELSSAGGVASLLTGLGIDEYLTRTDGSGRAHLLADALGSILSLTDDTGTMQSQYSYEPFGRTTVTGSSNSNPFQYTARESDGTGLYYYRARYYHPQLQRFISQDPIGFAAGDANLYAYVGNDPVDWIDPDGLRVLNPHNYPVTPGVLAALTEFNACIGSNKDVVITSGNRPPSSRLGAGGASTHVQGTAADIVVPGQAHSTTAYQAIATGMFGGVGWYEEGYRGPQGEGPHVHVDLRRVLTTWGYDREGHYYQPLPPLPREAMVGRKAGCPATQP